MKVKGMRPFCLPPFLLLLLLVPSSPSPSFCSSPLRIGLLLPDQYRHRIQPWLALSLRHFHRLLSTNPPSFSSSSSSFSGHCLQLAPKDTRCRTSLGMKALFDLMGPAEGGNVMALFGDICTDVNEPVAMASKNWNIVHLSFTETHAKFGTADSKELYPTFFRMAPGERNLNRARNELIRAFGWRRIGSIKQSDDSSLALSHERLTTRLEQNGVKVVYTASLSSESSGPGIGAELEELKARDVHIIVADLSQPLAFRVLCAAFHHGLFGADFVWILPGSASQQQSFSSTLDGPLSRRQWWRDADRLTNCTQSELASVLAGHFAMDQASMRPFEDKLELVGGHSLSQVLRELPQICAESGVDAANCDQRHSPAHAAYAYDGLWALGLALNRSLVGEGEQDQPGDKKARLLEAMWKTDFQGLSGRVRFDESGERLGLVQIEQWENGSYSSIGFLDSAEGKFQLNKNSRWTPPPDSTLLLRRREYVSAPLLALMCSLAFAGICLALGFLIVNIKFRNHRFIKMSSPNMNNLIICGSLCAYLTIFLLSIDTRLVGIRRFEQICYAKIWILCFGFTLAFGAMFSKTWRVHSIFTNIRRDKKAIRDSKLYLIVAGLLSLDGSVLLLWALVSPFRLALYERGQFKEQNRLIVPELERCESEHSLAFQLVFIISKGLLMLFGCFLAWETRAVNVPALNDSKYIGIAVYAVVVMCAVGLALAFILQEHLNEAFAIISFFIIFCTTLTLCLVFVPKVVELWRTPKGAEQQRLNHRKGMMKSVVGRGGGSSVLAGGRGKQSSGGGAHSVISGIGATHEGLNRQISLISAEELARRSAQLESENLRLHQTLVSKSAELWDLLEKVKLLTDQLNGTMEGNEKGVGGRGMFGGGLSVPAENGEGGAGELGRRRSARLLSSVAQQFRLKRTKTTSSNRL